MSDSKEAFDRGLALRRDMFGVAGADKAVESASDFSRPLQEMVTRFCFGEVWQRPGLRAFILKSIKAAFAEDVFALGNIARARREDPDSDFAEKSIGSDRAGVMLRRTLRALAERERQ
jgi:hypothetical protein